MLKRTYKRAYTKCYNETKISQVINKKSPQKVCAWVVSVSVIKMARRCVEGKNEGDEKVFE